MAEKRTLKMFKSNFRHTFASGRHASLFITNHNNNNYNNNYYSYNYDNNNYSGAAIAIYG